jgi:hypothetical protein
MAELDEEDIPFVDMTKYSDRTSLLERGNEYRQVTEEDEGVDWGDYVKAFAAGSKRVAGSASGIAEYVTADPEWGETRREWEKSALETEETMSPAARRAARASFIPGEGEDSVWGEGVGRSLALKATGTSPSFLATLVPAALVGPLAGPALAAAAATGTGAALSAGDVINSVYDNIDKVPDDVLMQSDVYAGYIDMGLSPAEARSAYARHVAGAAPLFAGALSYRLGGAEALLARRMGGEEVAQGFWDGARKGLTREGLQEGVEEGAGSLLSQGALRSAGITSDVDWLDALNAAVEGAATGGPMGAAVGAASGARRRPEEAIPTEVQPGAPSAPVELAPETDEPVGEGMPPDPDAAPEQPPEVAPPPAPPVQAAAPVAPKTRAPRKPKANEVAINTGELAPDVLAALEQTTTPVAPQAIPEVTLPEPPPLPEPPAPPVMMSPAEPPGQASVGPMPVPAAPPPTAETLPPQGMGPARPLVDPAALQPVRGAQTAAIQQFPEGGDLSDPVGDLRPTAPGNVTAPPPDSPTLPAAGQLVAEDETPTYKGRRVLVDKEQPEIVMVPTDQGAMTAEQLAERQEVAAKAGAPKMTKAPAVKAAVQDIDKIAIPTRKEFELEPGRRRYARQMQAIVKAAEAAGVEAPAEARAAASAAEAGTGKGNQRLAAAYEAHRARLDADTATGKKQEFYDGEKEERRRRQALADDVVAKMPDMPAALMDGDPTKPAGRALLQTHLTALMAAAKKAGASVPQRLDNGWSEGELFLAEAQRMLSALRAKKADAEQIQQFIANNLMYRNDSDKRAEFLREWKATRQEEGRRRSTSARPTSPATPRSRKTPTSARSTSSPRSTQRGSTRTALRRSRRSSPTSWPRRALQPTATSCS